MVLPFYVSQEVQGRNPQRNEMIRQWLRRQLGTSRKMST